MHRNIWTKKTIEKGISLLALFLPMVLMNIISAVEFTVEVKAGDWVKYEVSTSWTGTGAEPWWTKSTELWEIDWIKMEIQSVSGTVVSIKPTIHYNIGIDWSNIWSYNLQSYAGELIPIVSANLKRGDPISNMGSPSNRPIISDTITRVYAGASRNVNVLDLSGTTQITTQETYLYFDQATGVMLEMSAKESPNDASGIWQTSIKATETNIWTADFVGMISSNLLYIMIVAVAIIVIIVGVFAVRRKNSTKYLPSKMK